MLGVGLSVPQIAESSPVAAFSPLSLFFSSEPGVWFDPSDLSTMFQDNNGNSPVTATGQTVGLILDKSRGLARGSELVTNGTFDTNLTGWTNNGTVTASWSNGAASVTRNAFGDMIYQAVSCTIGRTYLVSVEVKSGTLARIGFNAVIQGSNTEITNSAGVGTYSGYVVATASTMYVQLTCGANATAIFDNVSVREVSGMHARQATSTSRPTLQQDAGGRYYLNFDGTDDSLATPSVDFSGTNKLTVSAGVRKASDTAVGAIAELTASFASNNGSFNLSGPYLAGATNYSFISKGTTAAINTISGYTSPITNVITGLGDISAPSNIIRVNGSQVGSAITTSQGTGNYANSILYIGCRGGASNPFNGRLYSLVIRGATTSGANLTSLESWVNGKTGAY